MAESGKFAPDPGEENSTFYQSVDFLDFVNDEVDGTYMTPVYIEYDGESGPNKCASGDDPSGELGLGTPNLPTSVAVSDVTADTRGNMGTSCISVSQGRSRDGKQGYGWVKTRKCLIEYAYGQNGHTQNAVDRTPKGWRFQQVETNRQSVWAHQIRWARQIMSCIFIKTCIWTGIWPRRGVLWKIWRGCAAQVFTTIPLATETEGQNRTLGYG